MMQQHGMLFWEENSQWESSSSWGKGVDDFGRGNSWKKLPEKKKKDLDAELVDEPELG